MIKKAMKHFDEALPDVWDGMHASSLGRNFRHFAENVVGLSVDRLLPHLDALKARADGSSVRLAEANGKETLQVRDADGNWFGIRVKTRPNEERESEVIDVVISHLDPDRLDYAYPERIAFTTIVKMPDSVHANGSCTLGEFGLCAAALKAFADAAGLDRSPVPAASMREKNRFNFSDSNDVLALDGGIVGPVCLEAAERMSAAVYDRIMRRAHAAFAGVADGLVSEGAAWGLGTLVYNDLDNNVAVLPEANGRGRAIIHRNGSYISEFRTYVLEQSEDGRKTDLYALCDGSDDFREFVNLSAVNGGASLPPTATAASRRKVFVTRPRGP